ncbi:MAG: Esterase, partial [Actinomycetia bacterium]|nr:Esterase [Actinomycetes bacterium]
PLGLGWWAAAADGRVVAAGDARHFGDLAGRALNRPIVGLARTPSGAGYWLVASDGGIFTFGDARFLGSTGSLRLNQPIVGMAATPSGGGYWLVASDGGIFTFGDARFFGSTGALHLQAPIVGVAATPSGGGYWLAAADGGVFTFGDAVFHGAGRGPVTAVAATPSGGGYWLAGGDGHVDAEGDAVAAGAPGPVDGSVTGIAPTPSGRGYWLAVGRVADVVTVYQPGGLTAATRQWALDAAGRAGARATVYDGGNVDLLAVRRGSTVVQAAPVGWRIPMSATAVDPAGARPLVGATAADALARGELVLGVATARLRGARVGDDVDVLGWDGRVHTLRVGALVPDARAGASELVLSTAGAAAIGFRFPSTVVLWGGSRAGIDQALAARPAPVRVSISRTWQYDPDDVAPLVRLKQLLGEPVYRPGRGDSVALRLPGITTGRVPLLGNVTCNRAIFPALRGALTDVARAGLGRGLGRYGGCYNARLIRDERAGRLSRHSLGIAIDVNTANNTFGGRVSMDPRIVAIFRRWGFAWGGTWARADGMHFEWSPR